MFTGGTGFWPMAIFVLTQKIKTGFDTYTYLRFEGCQDSRATFHVHSIRMFSGNHQPPRETDPVLKAMVGIHP